MPNWVDDNFPCKNCQFREDNDNGICMKRGICQIWGDYNSESLRILRLYELCAPITRCKYSCYSKCVMEEKTHRGLCSGLKADIMRCNL